MKKKNDVAKTTVAVIVIASLYAAVVFVADKVCELALKKILS